METEESKDTKNTDTKRLTDWIDRNCTACKFVGKECTPNEVITRCIVPNEILQLVCSGRELSKKAKIIMVGPNFTSLNRSGFRPLFRCYSRKDRRGRKRKPYHPR